MGRCYGGSAGAGPQDRAGARRLLLPVAAFLASTRNEIERFVTDWESRESAYNL